MILVTGTPRSGTKYTAELLGKTMNIEHEQLTVHGSVSWKHAPFSVHFRKVFHQVRNPIDCIASMRTIHYDSILYMSRFIPIDMNGSGLKQCMQIWLLWNEFCEKQADKTFRVEDMENHYCDILESFGYRDTMPELPKDINSRKHDKINIKDLLKEDSDLAVQIIKKANYYGYFY